MRVPSNPPGPDAPHLLIIDDERPLRLAVRRWFSRRGWHCAEAESLAQAESLLFTAGVVAPDVILCDVNLPDGTGLQLLERIEREQPALTHRLILSTGEVLTRETLAHLEEVGCRTLAKPFDLSQAEVAARSAIEEARKSA